MISYMKRVKAIIIFILLENLYLFGFNNMIFAQNKEEKTGFTIVGSIKNELIEDKIFLEYYTSDNKLIRDSCQIHNGMFSFVGKMDNPTISYLKSVDNKLYQEFWLENSKIKIEIIKNDNVLITGSNAQNEYDMYKSYISKFMSRFKQLDIDYKNAQQNKDNSALSKIVDEWSKLLFEKSKSTKEWISSHPSSYVSLDLILQLSTQRNVIWEELMTYLNYIDKSIINTAIGSKVVTFIQNQKDVSDENAPEFALPDLNGKMVKLSDFKGNYVLIDFWASWCAPCREENPNVLKAYNAYHKKGLEIIAISLDTNKDEWLSAIIKDKLPWIHVCDFMAAKSEVVNRYKISGIPMNFLITPEGRIVGRNLRGKALDFKLKEIFEE